MGNMTAVWKDFFSTWFIRVIDFEIYAMKNRKGFFIMDRTKRFIGWNFSKLNEEIVDGIRELLEIMMDFWYIW